MRQYVNAYLHLNMLALILVAVYDGIQYACQLIAQEYGDYSGRSFVSTQSVVIARSCNARSQNVLIVVNSLDDSSQEQQELCVLSRCLSGLQQVYARVCGK